MKQVQTSRSISNTICTTIEGIVPGRVKRSGTSARPDRRLPWFRSCPTPVIAFSVVMLCLCNPLIGATGEPKTYVQCETEADGRVLVRWSVPKWDEDLIGFRLLRREQAEDSSWTKWYSHGPAIVQPDFSEARLKKLGLTQVLAKMPEWRKAGNPMEADAVVKKLASEPKDFRPILFMCLANRQWALAFGLAWRDDSVKKGKTYEYAVAKIVRGPSGRKVREPFGTVRVTVGHGGFAGPPLESFKARRVRQKAIVVLEWSVAKDRIAARRDLVRWSILAGKPEEPLKKQAATKSLSSRSAGSDGNFLKYRVSVRAADDAKHKYALAPVNKFGTAGRLSRRVVVERRQPDLTSPERVWAELIGGKCIVRWVHHIDARVQGYEILRQTVSHGTEVVTDALVPYGRRQWTDSNLAGCAGKRISYSVRVISGDYRRGVISKSSIPVSVPLPKPKPPRDFKAELVYRSGKRYVVCTWTPAPKGASVGYIVRKLIPSQKLWVDFGTSKTGCLEKTIGNAGQVLVLRVVAVTRGGPPSGPSDEVRLAIPTAGPFKVSGVSLQAKVLKDKGVHFQWYAPAWSRVAGFRLLVDGKEIANEKILGRYVRQYKSWNVPADAKEYKLVVVDPGGREAAPITVRSPSARAAPSAPPLSAAVKAAQKRDVTKAEKYMETRTYLKDKTKVYSKQEWVRWKDGLKVLHGVSTHYRRDGKVRQTVRFRLGKRHGIFRGYDAQGKLSLMRFYLDDKRASFAELVAKEGDDELTHADRDWLKSKGRLK